MTKQNYPENDPRHHTAHVKDKLDDLVAHLREDLNRFDEPKAQAMFETTVEVLLGLRKAFEDYETGSEEGMQNRAATQ